jgi:hypothetical protein
MKPVERAGFPGNALIMPNTAWRMMRDFVEGRAAPIDRAEIRLWRWERLPGGSLLASR